MMDDNKEAIVGIDPAFSGSETVVTIWEAEEARQDGSRPMRLVDIMPFTKLSDRGFDKLLDHYRADIFRTGMSKEMVMGDDSPNQRHTAEADQLKEWLTAIQRLV